MTDNEREFIRAIVKEAMATHAAYCPLADRVRVIELRFASLVSFMAGSGILGGGIGAGLIAIFMR